MIEFLIQFLIQMHAKKLVCAHYSNCVGSSTSRMRIPNLHVIAISESSPAISLNAVSNANAPSPPHAWSIQYQISAVYLFRLPLAALIVIYWTVLQPGLHNFYLIILAS